jgi:predicted metal-dependent TIM-barrel fold hydrolase
VQAVFSTMLFAKEFDITYVHTPFEILRSNIKSTFQSSKKCEEFFNLGKDEITINKINKESLDVVHINNPIFITFKPNTLYIVEHCHSFVDSNDNAKLYSKITDRFIQKYQDSLKLAATVIKIPEKAVVLGAWMRAVAERGEDGGTQSSVIGIEYKEMLNQSIMLDSGNTQYESDWFIA